MRGYGTFKGFPMNTVIGNHTVLLYHNRAIITRTLSYFKQKIYGNPIISAKVVSVKYSPTFLHNKVGKKRAAKAAPKKLFFDDFQNTHGAILCTDTAGNALGSGIAFLNHNDLHGAGLSTLAAANAKLLVDHVHTGLGILGNGAMLTSTHTLATLNASLGLCTALTITHNLDAAVILMELLVEGF